MNNKVKDLNIKQGHHLNSRGNARKYKINNYFFKNVNPISAYYAGWIAADGNIDLNERELRIGIKSTDFVIFDNFISHAESTYGYRTYINNKGFTSINMCISSNILCSDLKEIYNIIPQKSLVLIPPKIKDLINIDSFIIGYIDGDGSIGLYNSKRQKSLQIQIFGTFELLKWIEKRFSDILGYEINVIYKKNNIHVLVISDLRARKIFQHYYQMKSPKLERKWKLEYYEHCINFKKYRNIENYKLIYDLSKTMNNTQIAKQLNVSSASISWYKKQELYKTIEDLN